MCAAVQARDDLYVQCGVFIKTAIIMTRILLLSADINECCDDNGGCSHQCINTYQSYKCACPDDMVLGADGKNCTRKYGPYVYKS